MGVVLIKHRVKVNEQYCWDILLSQQNKMLDAIIASFTTMLFFSKTVHQCTVHIAFIIVQLIQCKPLSFLYSDLWPGNSPELNSTDYDISRVIQQHEHELQVTRLDK